MMFALYGEVSTIGSGKENELLSQFVDVRNDKPLVSLVFTAHQHGQEETYKITRTPRHIRPAKRTGAKQQEEGETAELLMPDGSQYPGKLSETNRKIEEIVGLTADQFRKVVMIAQGEFMDFLRAGSKEKTELLRDLLKTDYYYQLSERLKTLAKEKNTAAKTQRANMSFCGESGDGRTAGGRCAGIGSGERHGYHCKRIAARTGGCAGGGAVRRVCALAAAAG